MTEGRVAVAAMSNALTGSGVSMVARGRMPLPPRTIRATGYRSAAGRCAAPPVALPSHPAAQPVPSPSVAAPPTAALGLRGGVERLIGCE